MAQWTRRLTTNQEIPGSTPGSLIFLVFNYVVLNFGDIVRVDIGNQNRDLQATITSARKEIPDRDLTISSSNLFLLCPNSCQPIRMTITQNSLLRTMTEVISFCLQKN
ncbi:hypothetical protein PHYBLDRAFT_63384 [Phycomyces blakesleeanus NRRL 1555(-)]|uniref:Uncharacterized protein n=1 Tax=Phycomyces blakesleeanus (strain ATCC 8743b / DSM 1359 / FGSC 10004 / NBRC 33097 / NRRL 1555) TaxID=763407 RepID=A0A163D4P3_PHYB8|nr:hypothetical protein PHYBLDRAFT_63384 [Phycomyces blakesleeanus NRRL 1555(-)]OAD68710.1 hypothetical protein PHYBLDRAFT_63384 [Phycomyces blakesleeanus NRRL 1555(-)]|eukprot:XP_018286750.1 hypothetical protein PHYBLDRAFT_63384 [Phycomyces blakesleeanus NRRL 1555(-)]